MIDKGCYINLRGGRYTFSPSSRFQRRHDKEKISSLISKKKKIQKILHRRNEEHTNIKYSVNIDDALAKITIYSLVLSNRKLSAD